MIDNTKQLYGLGVSFRHAPAAVREKLAFNGEQAAALLQQVAAESPGTEALILSTCIRTEFYLAAPANQCTYERFRNRK